MGTAPQGWQTPKTDWTTEDPVGNGDLNRIEQNEESIENGNRTIDDAQAPSSDTGPLRSFLDWLANRIKAIIGKTNWYDAPSISLEGAYNHKQNTSNPHSVTKEQVGLNNTDGLPEGGTNKYFSGKNLDNLPDGSSYQRVTASFVDGSGKIEKIKSAATFESAVTRYWSLGTKYNGGIGTYIALGISEVLYMPFLLPHGAVVTGLWMYLGDAAANVEILMQCGGVDSHTEVLTMGNFYKQGSKTSGFNYSTIDNSSRKYWLRFNGVATAQQIEGVVIRYTVDKPANGC